jgi:2,4-dienoyl-CoA reductase (NADPH2)
MEKYPNIFSPGTIGGLVTKNRIKYAATETNFPFGDGYVSEREIAYMEAQAKGGAGIITTQGAYPDAKGEGKGFKGMMAIYDDRFIPGLARIADVIRKNNALSALQILHCGREGGVELSYCLMPSVVPQRLSYFKPPREITLSEIKQTVEDHVNAAKRAVQAGFDMIELSGIVGYLISTFISRYSNKRQDEYGGESVRERCRLMVEVIQAVKAEVGDRVPVGIRLCGHELLDDRGGNTFDESVESFRIAEEAGADYLSVTVGWHETSVSVITRDVPMGHWLSIAGEIKRHVDVPVMMAFRQFLPYIPEKAIAGGIIDFWEACRPMIADPAMPLKIAEGREDEIVPCIACNLCFSRLYYHQPIGCSVRPSLGHESEPRWGYYGFAETENPKQVVVVGGGPAGLQCASVAAQRGHKVTILEKEDRLGGCVNMAAQIDDGSEELLRPVRALEVECLKAGVDIRTSTTCTVDLLERKKADVIIVAIGGTTKPFGFLKSARIFTLEEVILEKKALPLNLAIIGGNGAGLGVALYLVRRGVQSITIVEEGRKVGRDMNPFYLWRCMRILKSRNLSIITEAVVTGATENKLLLGTPKGDKRVEADAVIMALRQPAGEWVEAVKGLAKEVYVVGDAKRPRRLNNAIHDGYRLGMEI